MTEDEYLKQGTDKLDEYHSMVNSIVELFPEPRRSQITGMLDGPMGEQFMTAPASTKRRFHYAFPCGLVAHSLNVVRNAWKIADALWPNRWPKWQIAFVALFHDLGKAGSPGKPFYVQQDDMYWRKKGEYYQVSQDEYMPNSEKSLFVLQLHGVTLTHEETVAIRLNDGMGPEENRGYEFREPDLALVIHWADHAAMRMEKAENK